jgi:hypothetical protein
VVSIVSRGIGSQRHGILGSRAVLFGGGRRFGIANPIYLLGRRLSDRRNQEKHKINSTEDKGDRSLLNVVLSPNYMAQHPRRPHLCYCIHNAIHCRRLRRFQLVLPRGETVVVLGKHFVHPQGMETLHNF